MALMPSGFGGLFDPAFMFPFGRGEQRTRDPLDFSALMPSLTSVAPSMSTHPTGELEKVDRARSRVRALCAPRGRRRHRRQCGVLLALCTQTQPPLPVIV